MTILLRLGAVSLMATPPSAAAHACSAGFVTLGWQAFGRGRIIIDPPGGTLRIAPSA